MPSNRKMLYMLNISRKIGELLYNTQAKFEGD